MTPPDETALLEAVVRLASELTGFRDAALPADRLRRALRLLAAEPDATDLARRVELREPRVCAAVREAVCIGETFFQRHPEQLSFLSSHLAARPSQEPLRVWSAGCSSGEEVYTLALQLVSATLPGNAPPLLLGTDVRDGGLDVARAGRYRNWSLRGAGALRAVLGRTDVDGSLVIRDELRAVTRFRRHDLLREGVPEEAPFDLVLCRNVLVYMRPESIATAVDVLRRSLVPGGLIAFGPMDLVEPPVGLEAVGSADLQLFRRPSETPVRAEPVRSSPPPARPVAIRPLSAPPPPRPAPIVVGKAPPTPAPEPAPADPVQLHVAALSAIDSGLEAQACELLDGLVLAQPAYLPGLLERGLLATRSGDDDMADRLMRDVLRRARELSPDALVHGPEPLPARFFVASAAAYLERAGLEGDVG